MMYVTNLSVYFFSPFNPKTLLGRGSKLTFNYDAISDIKKETTLVVFNDAIRFSFKSGGSFLFRSYIHRDTCFSMI
jgi:hypothetical protein